jgi:hypothetical protein
MDAGGAERDELIAAFLADRDESCPGCGYNLRGLERGRCPECERPLVLRIEPLRSPLGVFVAGLVALAGGSAFSLAVGIYVLAAGMWGGSAAGAITAVWPAPLTAVFQAALAAEWIRRAGWVSRLPRGTQHGFVAACWAVGAGLCWLTLRRVALGWI